MEEIWKDIKFTEVDGIEYNYEGLYQVSNTGQIKSLRGKEKILKQDTSHGRYNKILLLDREGNRKHHFIHRLVAFMFVPNDNPTEKKVANHLNEDSFDNRAENLEWTTQQANINHGTRTERMIATKRVRQKFDENYNKRCKGYKATHVESGEVLIFANINEVVSAGFSRIMVYDCCNGKYRTHSSHKWEKIW